MNMKKINRYKSAFTLAEVVIVMGILSVMMVAFAPVISKRTVSTTGAFRNFRATDSHNGIYFGTPNDEKTVLIGNNVIANGYNLSPKLLLTTFRNKRGNSNENLSNSFTNPHIGFMTFSDGQEDNTPSYSGQLLLADNTVILGGKRNSAYNYNELSNANTIIGVDACIGDNDLKTHAEEPSNYNYTFGNVCIGANAGLPEDKTRGDHNIYIGHKSVEYNPDNIYFGNKSLSELMAGTAIASAIQPHMSALLSWIGAFEHNHIYKVSHNIVNGQIRWVVEKKNMQNVFGENYTMPVYIVPPSSGFPTESDRRLKNVGELFVGGLQELSKLEFFHYTYKNDENKTPHVGVIAQNLQEVFPDAVKENAEGFLYIRTEDMFYAGLNAIKELYQIYLDHDKRLNDLEAENAQLRQMYMELAKRIDKLDGGASSKEAKKIEKARKKALKQQQKAIKAVDTLTQPIIAE